MENEKKEKNKGGRPPGSGQIEFDYKHIDYLRSRGATIAEVATSCGITEDGLYKRMRRDEDLRTAINGGYNKAKISLRVAQFRKAVEHYMTICMDCHKIADAQFLESCPYCDALDPQNEGKHTNVKHKHIPADTGMLIHLGKHILGQSDQSLVVVTGDKTKDPVQFQFEGLTDAQLKQIIEQTSDETEAVSK